MVPSLEVFGGMTATQSVASKRKKAGSLSGCSPSTSTSQISRSESSLGKSSIVTSESGPSEDMDVAGSQEDINPLCMSTAVDVVPPNSLTACVLFGGHGMKAPAKNTRLCFARIDVAVSTDDAQYKKL